jgi:hypothetical protein
MSAVRIIKSLDWKIWDNYIIGNDESNIFHTSNWIKLIINTYNYKLFWIAYYNHESNKVFYLPFAQKGKRIINFPYCDYFKSMSINDNMFDDILKYLLNENIISNNIKCEIKDNINSKYMVSELMAVIHTKQFTNNFSETEKKFSDIHKRNTRKAIKYGLKTIIDKSLDGIEQYFKLHLITRKRQGIPSQPKLFFYNLYNEIIKTGLGFVCLVYKNDIAVAGGVFLHFNNTFTYKFGASDPKYLYLKPNNLMFYDMIKYSVENGYMLFDFGKTDIDNVGLRKFKSGWDAEEKPLYFSFFPSNTKNKYFNILKENILAPIIKNSPKIICRILGELFYKRFGT